MAGNRELIIGAPGAGKSTYARGRQRQGWEVLEKEHFKSDAAFKRAVSQVSRTDLDLAVVRCCFSLDERAEWEALLSPTRVVVVNPGLKECKSRLHKRGNGNWRGEIAAAERWFRNWENGGRVEAPRKRAKRPQRKLSSTARGYGSKHQAARRRFQREVDAGAAFCARCRRPIVPGEAWDLDHAPGKQGYLGPSHAHCNRVAGAKLGAAISNAKKRKKAVSRRW